MSSKNTHFNMNFNLFFGLIFSVLMLLNAQSSSAQTDSASQEPETVMPERKAPAPWPEVRPKRIGVPTQSQAGNLIDVQITGRKTVTVPTDAPAPKGDMQAWFWTAVPNDLAGAAPERFALGLAALEAPEARALIQPEFQRITEIAAAHSSELLLTSIETNISPALALAVIYVESTGDPQAVSRSGAQGLMQLIPATAERFDVSDAFDPAQNIRGGMTYLRWLLDEFNGDVLLALAGYNAGENTVKDAGGVPMIAETRAYVPKVLRAWQSVRGLCVTPPELYSDGCVFATNAIRSN